MSSGSALGSVALPRPSGRTGFAVWIYFSSLTVATILGDPTGLLAIPLQFTLKDQLGLGPQSLALFEVITLIPVYFGFVLGFVRDRWRPFSLGDRGYLLLGSLIAIASYLSVVAGEVAFMPLLGAVSLAMLAYQLFDISTDALLTVVAQRHFMTGRLSAVVEGVEAVPGIAALLVGGWIATHSSLGVALIAATLCSVVILAHVFWYPREVADAEDGDRPESHSAEISRLWTDIPLRRAVVVATVWSLTIGWGTPYLFYLSDDLGFSSEVFAVCRVVGLICAVVMAPVYGVWCQRVTLKHSLRIAILFSLFPGFLYLGVSEVWQAVAVAVVVGLPTAFGQIALFDLLRRACPRHLEGTAMTLAYTAFAVSASAGDLIGSWLYTQGGFLACLFVDMAANAAVLPLVAALPGCLLSRRDGESDTIMAE